MGYVLAIDVGTSFTAAAIIRIDQNAPRVPESLPLGLRGSAVPSVVFYPEEGPVLVGEPAERRGLDSPERVVREFKRRIGDEIPIFVGTLRLPAEDVFATMARWVADRAEEREGGPPSDIVLSHPASWGAHRTGLIRVALAARGLSNVTLISEPEAAALHYASQVRVDDGSTIGVYDLGGGTFDTAILKKTDAGHFALLGRPDGIEQLGGADFDAAVLHHVSDHTGEGLAGLDPSAPGVLAALSRLRRECVEAKEALSSDSEASISVLLPGFQQQVRLVRSEFEAMIEGPIRETVDALERSLQELGLTPADLTAVLLIGGSSRIPLVAQLISAQLERPIAVDADPKSSICLGAAVAALRRHPDAVDRPAAGTPEAAIGPAAAQAASVGAHGAARASWSRHAGSGFGGGAVVGVGVVAHRAGGGHKSSPRAGTHGPRASVRVTAVAAVAALFTGLTATAAQSPDGLGSLTAMFAAQQAGAAKDSAGAAPVVPGGQGSGGALAAGAGAGVPLPAQGIEASAEKNDSPAARSAGLDIAASLTGRDSISSGPSGGTAAGGAPPVPVTNPTNGPGPVIVDPVPGPTTAPVPTTDPAPVPDPTADPTSVADPTTAPVPAPTTDSAPSPTTMAAPSPTTDPSPSPTSDPSPSPTSDPSPSPTSDPSPSPTTVDAPVAEPSPTMVDPVLPTEPVA